MQAPQGGPPFILGPRMILYLASNHQLQYLLYAAEHKPVRRESAGRPISTSFLRAKTAEEAGMRRSTAANWTPGLQHGVRLPVGVSV